MRSRTVSLLLLVAATALGPGAAQAGGLVGKGLKLGVALPTFHGRDARIAGTGTPYDGQGPRARTTFAGGVFADFDLGANVALQPELLYVSKGARYEVGQTALDLRLSYLELPVLLRVSVPTGHVTSPYLLLGPTAAVRLGATADASAPFGSASFDIGDEVNGLDFGAAAALGTVFGDERGRVVVEARYTIGLTSVDKPDRGWTIPGYDFSALGDDLTIRNGVLSFMIGRLF